MIATAPYAIASNLKSLVSKSFDSETSISEGGTHWAAKFELRFGLRTGNRFREGQGLSLQLTALAASNNTSQYPVELAQLP